MESKQILDFETSVGTNPIHFSDLRQVINFYPYADPNRLILVLMFSGGLRPAEPCQLKWNNFVKGRIYFRPKKTKGKIKRIIKLSSGVWTELMTYKNTHIFPMDKSIFDFDHNQFRYRFDKHHRKKIGGQWLEYSGNMRCGTVSQFYYYTMRCFRTTMATLVFHYYSQVYGKTDIALYKTAKYMGHSAKRTTADYYISRVDKLGLDKLPKLPMLQLIDHILYKEIQVRMDQFIEEERQAAMCEY